LSAHQPETRGVSLVRGAFLNSLKTRFEAW